jgi:hypothetical protein
MVIEADPSEQALRGLRQRTSAVWSAIERACEDEDFRPKPSALCSWCTSRQYCPAFGGDPALAATIGAERHGRGRGRRFVGVAWPEMSWPVVDAVDDRLDAVIGRWRGRPMADGLAYGASALGDHGLSGS